ncbi:MAG TPA: class I mannose-6-phosphate isomerase [Gaiellaceae bacterium]|nr:class I mannose-6-phosphate isomerase [Gaiellaceae bacterium]
MSYDPEPTYPLREGAVDVGYEALAEAGARDGIEVIAVDGASTVAWDRATAGLRSAFTRLGSDVEIADMRRHALPWAEVERLTTDPMLADDPAFARIPEVDLRELLGELPDPSAGAPLTLVVGPGAALVPHDLLWWLDLPKANSLAAVRRGQASNLGQPPGEIGTEKRLLFVDWPLLDRHKRAHAHRLDRLVDVTDPTVPRSLTGDSLRASLSWLSGRPFRTRPMFLPGPWGGQWLRTALGIETDETNLAWSYELITPESGILFGDGPTMEVGFELLLAAHPERVLGTAVAERFGATFPIRFDYLDTMEGGHLSVQCHPGERYARETFGLDYTQEETYYVMATTPGGSVFLGLREDADVDAFREEAERAESAGVAFDPDRYLVRHPAERHRLYLIPPGTPHASGAGNAVLEISATPYLYTLRFYDWLRRNGDGRLRPVHIDHAFANLDRSRNGARVAELVPAPTEVREGHGWRELLLGRHPELFFAVHRLDFTEEVEDDTRGRFHVLNLVEGEVIEIVTASGDVHPLSFAETVVVPAAVGAYRLRRIRGSSCKVVKALVP